MIVGHKHCQQALADGLPKVVLMTGPPSVGKTTFAFHFLRLHEVHQADTLVPKAVNADAARQLHRFFSTAPMGPAKAAVLNIDRTSTEALNALLKLLEEPPPSTHVLLTTTKRTMLTVESRAYVLRFGLLTDAEVAKILIAKFKFSPDDAAIAARASGGQVRRALQSADLATNKGPVLSLLKAAADGDENLFYNALARWGQREHQLLTAWLTETTTGNYCTFDQAETFGLAGDRRTTSQMTTALRVGARPKITAKLALMDTLERNR